MAKKPIARGPRGKQGAVGRGKSEPAKEEPEKQRGAAQGTAGRDMATLADAGIPQDALVRLSQVSNRIVEVRRRIAEGGEMPELEARARAYERREQELRAREILAKTKVGGLDGSLERTVGVNDILLIGFLAAGMVAARGVGRIRLDPPIHGGGTGFLVSPDMVMTNHHVIPSVEQAQTACIDFEEHDFLGELDKTAICGMDPGRFFYTDPDLDITIVALADVAEVRAKTEPLGWHPMIAQEGKIRIGDPVNIIQYPGGRFQRGERLKALVMHNSNLMYLDNDSEELHPFCWYSSDTEPGSSGSPVFNNRWEIVAVHHKSIPQVDAAGHILDNKLKPMTKAEYEADPERALYWANEGVRTSRVVASFERWEPPSRRERGLKEDLLALWRGSLNENLGQKQARAAVRAALGRGGAGAGLEAAGAPQRVGGVNGVAGPINIYFTLPGG